MLRLMVMRKRFFHAVLLVSLSIAGCGDRVTSSSEPVSGLEPALRERLLAAADEEAARSEGTARRVEAVRTTAEAASEVFGALYSTPDAGRAVWLVQISGDDFACGACPRPEGAPPQRGAFATVFVPDTGSPRPFTIGPNDYDLARLGQVEVLRDEE